MKILIALKGRANSGKSSTIKTAYGLLKERNPETLNEVFIDGVDIKVIMTIDGIKVGIESQGDPDSRLGESLKDFSIADCKVIVCATRTRGMTVNWVNQQSDYTPEWLWQYSAEDGKHEQNNQSQAQKIADRVGEIINA